jgi:hypothetical protein
MVPARGNSNCDAAGRHLRTARAITRESHAGPLSSVSRCSNVQYWAGHVGSIPITRSTFPPGPDAVSARLHGKDCANAVAQYLFRGAA